MAVPEQVAPQADFEAADRHLRTPIGAETVRKAETGL
jgi:hypothetical protein